MRKTREHTATKAQPDLSVGKFKALLENAYDGFVLYDSVGDIVYVSPSIKKFGGFSVHDLIGRRGSEFIHPDEQHIAREAFAKVLLKPGGSITLTQRFKSKHGSYFWAEYTLTNLLHNPEVKGIVSNFRNVDDRKIAEESARQSQQLLNTISDNITDGIFLGVPQEKFEYVNKAFLEITGYKSLAEIQKLKPHFLFADVEVWRSVQQWVDKHGSIKNVEALFRRKDGKLIKGLLCLTLLNDHNNKPLFVGSVRDITKQRVAEEELTHSQQLLNAISKNINEAIYRSSAKGIVYANDAFVRMFGFKNVNEVLQLHPESLYASAKVRQTVMRELRKSGRVTNQEVQLKRGNCDIFWGLMSCTMIKDAKGHVFLDGAIRDVTEQKKAEQQLIESQQLLSSINKNISEGLFRSDGKKFLYVNEAFAKMFGYTSPEQLLKTAPQKLYARLKDRKEMLDRLRKSGRLVNQELLYKRKDGSKFWGMVSYNLIKSESGEFFMDGSVRDITSQKEAERKLIESRTFIDNVMKTVAAPIFVKDSKHRWIMFNDAFCWFMGKSRQELAGRTDYDFVNKDEAKVFWKIDNQVLRTGDVILNREKITNAKGNVRHLLTVKSRYIDDRGEKFVIGFITDITDIKKVEDRIGQLNANLQGVMESTQESIYALDKNYCYTAFNKNHARMARILYGREIAIGDKKLDYIKGTQEEIWLAKELRKAMRGEQLITEHKVNHVRYKNRFIQTTYNPIRNKEGKVSGVAVFVRDITEMRNAQESIKQANATLRGVLESTKDQIIAIDKQYRYIMFNQAHERSIRLGTGNIIKKETNVLDAVPKDRKQIAKNEIDRALKGESFISEYNLQGGVVLEASYNPIFDESNETIGVTIFMRDVTLRKKTEQKLKALNDELTMQNWQLAAQEEELKSTLEELSERNFELDQLMYKTSHDLRSPLSSILGLVHLANLDDNPENFKVYLDKIEGRINKLDEFIRSMLNYAQVNRTETQYEQVDLEETVKVSLRDLEYLENFKDVNVSVETNGQRVFKSDPLRVGIIFSNIISNAFKYYNPAVKSYLKIRIEVNAFQAKVEFKDNGIGIREEYVPRIFDMFYRATEKSQGSGLGMYIVKQAIDKLKGSITVRSTHGKGTVVQIVLPNN